MGLAQAIGWALGLYESDEHYQKRLNRWQRQQDKNVQLIIDSVLLYLKLDGYAEAKWFIEMENASATRKKRTIPFPDIDLAIKRIWATKPEIIEEITKLNYKQYYKKLEKEQKEKEFKEQNKVYRVKDKELLDKEEEILQLKIRLAELEKNK